MPFGRNPATRVILTVTGSIHLALSSADPHAAIGQAGGAVAVLLGIKIMRASMGVVAGGQSAKLVSKYSEASVASFFLEVRPMSQKKMRCSSVLNELFAKTL